MRQRKEHAFVDAAWYEIVACAFRCALGKHGRFNVNETIGIEKLAGFHCHAVTQHQVVLHIGAAQIEHPVGQARGLGKVVVIKLERRCNAGVEYRHFVAQHFDLAALQAFVDGAIRPGANHALDLNTKLVAHAFSSREHVSTVRVANHLHITFTVAQVDKNHAAMVAPAVDPAAKADGLAHQGFGHQTAIV